MQKGVRLSAVALAAAAATANAKAISEVTDFEIYASLAPCVTDAISNDIDNFAYSTDYCPSSASDDITALQSCLCSNRNPEVLSTLLSSISSDVDDRCGTYNVEPDQSSASSMMKLYCSQSLTDDITFAPPTSTVNAFITDIGQIKYLASCAQEGLSSAVMSPMDERCPPDASLYAPCVCSKVSGSVTSMISSLVKEDCSNTEDVTYAEQLFSQYCDMLNGTTSFATPKGPPGDMTYYISGMPDFKALDSCAQSGLKGAIAEQTYTLCASGPQALASCVCIKSGMSRMVSSSLTSFVKSYCSNTDTENLSSAVSVWEEYCSAAENKVKINVKDTATQTALDATGNETGATSKQGSGGSEPTSSAPSGSGSDSGNSSGSSSGDGDDDDSILSSSGISKGAVIGIAIAAVIVGILVLGVIGWILRRKHNRNKMLQQQRENNLQGGAGVPPGSHGQQQQPVELVPTKSELMGDEIRMLTPGSGYSKEGAGVWNSNNNNELQSPGGYSNYGPGSTVSPLSPNSQHMPAWSEHGQQPHPHSGAVELTDESRRNELPGGWQAQGGEQGQHGWQAGNNVRYEM